MNIQTQVNLIIKLKRKITLGMGHHCLTRENEYP